MKTDLHIYFYLYFLIFICRAFNAILKGVEIFQVGLVGLENHSFYPRVWCSFEMLWSEFEEMGPSIHETQVLVEVWCHPGSKQRSVQTLSKFLQTSVCPVHLKLDQWVQMALNLAQNMTRGSGDFLRCYLSNVQIFCKCSTLIRKFPRRWSLLFLPNSFAKYIFPSLLEECPNS